MNWEAINVIGQWIGNLIVIISLFYVIRQLRLNNTMNRISGLMSIADSARETHYLVADDRETGSLIYQGTKAPEKLDEIDRFRFELFWWGVLRQIESYYELYEQKILNEHSMKSYAAGSLVMIKNNSIMSDYWAKNAKDYSPAFRQWMNDQMDEFENQTLT